MLGAELARKVAVAVCSGTHLEHELFWLTLLLSLVITR